MEHLGSFFIGKGVDGPGEKVLNERQVLLDLSGSEREGEGGSSCSPKARNVRGGRSSERPPSFGAVPLSNDRKILVKLREFNTVSPGPSTPLPIKKLPPRNDLPERQLKSHNYPIFLYSTVTLLARFLGLSTSRPLATAT